MGLIAINNVIRKDSPIYYRHLYTGIAVVKAANNLLEAGIDFVIETNPLGIRTTNVTVNEEIDYPAQTLRKELKNAIEYLDKENRLPHQ
ncbi:MAG: hypothetical protein LBG72_01570 [Spirochaetaceae bacterium]|jgi:formyltetrahydrofolate synthetase|nr:hypothetical protein [Spirochaetaceae bacterium]